MRRGRKGNGRKRKGRTQLTGKAKEVAAPESKGLEKFELERGKEDGSCVSGILGTYKMIIMRKDVDLGYVVGVLVH